MAVVILLCACTVPALAAEEEPARILTVAFPNSPGIKEEYEDGTYGGSVYNWLQEISKYTGWEYEFIAGTTMP